MAGGEQALASVKLLLGDVFEDSAEAFGVWGGSGLRKEIRSVET
jgi:hypothetical protein